MIDGTTERWAKSKQILEQFKTGGYEREKQSSDDGRRVQMGGKRQQIKAVIEMQ